MRISTFALFALAASVTLVLPLAASPLLVNTGGTFSSTTPTSTWSAPNEMWTLSFEVYSNPTPYGYLSGSLFVFEPKNVVYTLNGSTLSSGPVLATFFATADGGGFHLSFANGSATTVFYASGAQYYTGPESAPAID